MNVTRPTEAATDAPVAGSRIGPARVLGAVEDRVRLDLDGIPVWATYALPYRYRAEPGDRLLVAGEADRWYVIGILEGRGEVSLQAPGDLRLSAPRGAIDLTASEGVRIRGSRVELVAEKLEVSARSAVERFGRLRQRVEDALELRARRMRTRVDETHRLVAHRIAHRARDVAKIDGRRVHLG